MNTTINDDERTNSMGLFNRAEAYKLSAIKLRAGKKVKAATRTPLYECCTTTRWNFT
jgi:hypothetical protein